MSLAFRLALAFVGLVAVTALALGGAGLVAAERGVGNQVDDFLQDRAEQIVRGDRGRPEPGDRRRAGGRRRAADADSVAQLIGPNGRAVVSTESMLPINAEDRRLATGERETTQFRTVRTDEGRFRVITVALPDGGALQVGRELTESSRAVNLIRSQLLPTIAALAIAGVALGLLLARRITGPLRSLAASVDTVARTGDLDVAIEVNGDDEVGRLAAGFQNLLDGLADSRRRQRQLVQDAAHELRTPLTSVKANIDLLALAPDMDAAERAETFDGVRAELRELTHLVDEIVEVATDRHTPQALTDVDLAAVAAEAVQRFQARTGRSVDLVAPPAVAVLGDADSLERAVANLLSNADKYSPAGAPVEVSVTVGRRLNVTDCGPGIEAADRDRVFDRFYRADTARPQPGSGLGLSIVKSIIDAHGGTVEVGDGPAGGATVGFTLPPPSAARPSVVD